MDKITPYTRNAGTIAVVIGTKTKQAPACDAGAHVLYARQGAGT